MRAQAKGDCTLCCRTPLFVYTYSEGLDASILMQTLSSLPSAPPQHGVASPCWLILQIQHGFNRKRQPDIPLEDDTQ